MTFNVRSEILAAIGKTDDTESKTLLLLMLGVLEEIGSKIDAFLQDEKTLRDKVLNGHEANHHAHHDHVAKCIEQKCLATCTAMEKLLEEHDETVKNNKSLKQKFAEAVVAQAGTITMSIIAALIGAAALMK